MNKILIDGDGIIYRCGFATEKSKYLVTTNFEDMNEAQTIAHFDNHKEAKNRWEMDPTTMVIWSRKEIEPVENALALVKGALEAMPNGHQYIYLSPSVGNFRDKIATLSKYKGNRDAAKRPVHYGAIRDYLMERGAIETVGQEADDALGIAATALGEEAVVVSFDKDLDQIPGHHYNWVTKDAYSISKKLGDMNFYCQILSGDTVDNVDGLPGVGKVKAQRILEGVGSPEEAWDRILKEYKREFGLYGEARALETARLVYVRRKDNEIWQPPGTRAGGEAQARQREEAEARPDL